MRPFLTIGAFLLLTAPALGADWQEVQGDGFSISFPGAPKITDGAGQTKTYWLSEPGAELSLVVTDFTGVAADENQANDAALAALKAKGAVLADVNSRVARSYGRELSIDAGKDGRIVAAVFLVNHKLFVLEGRVAKDGPSSDAVRFQQSLNFPRGPGGFGGRGFGRFGR
jgi:hypothetical protein